LLVVGARRVTSGNPQDTTPEHRTIQRLESMMMMEEGGIITPRLHRRNERSVIWERAAWAPESATGLTAIAGVAGEFKM
jgi:hypothetical protein